jgi:hypothetical protein
MDALEKRLRSDLGTDWELWNGREEVLIKPYAGVSFRRKSWGEVYIMLEIWRPQGATVVGLARDRVKPKMAALDALLDAAFAKMPGKAGRYWAWYQQLPAEYGDWDGPALATMQFRQADLVDFWTREMLLVHKAASPVIDKFVKTN